MTTINGKSAVELELEAAQAAKPMADYTQTQAHPAADLVNALPCPFCGGENLSADVWCDDTGEYDAIECNTCLGAAPAHQWNNRRTPADAALSVGDILAGG